MLPDRLLRLRSYFCKRIVRDPAGQSAVTQHALVSRCNQRRPRRGDQTRCKNSRSDQNLDQAGSRMRCLIGRWSQVPGADIGVFAITTGLAIGAEAEDVDFTPCRPGVENWYGLPQGSLGGGQNAATAAPIVWDRNGNRFSTNALSPDSAVGKRPLSSLYMVSDCTR